MRHRLDTPDVGTPHEKPCYGVRLEKAEDPYDPCDCGSTLGPRLPVSEGLQLWQSVRRGPDNSWPSSSTTKSSIVLRGGRKEFINAHGRDLLLQPGSRNRSTRVHLHKSRVGFGAELFDSHRLFALEELDVFEL